MGGFFSSILPACGYERGGSGVTSIPDPYFVRFGGAHAEKSLGDRVRIAVSAVSVRRKITEEDRGSPAGLRVEISA